MVRPDPRRRRATPPTADGRAATGGGRFAPEAIAAAVRELEGGTPAPVVCRRYGVSDRTLYRWRRAAARGSD